MKPERKTETVGFEMSKPKPRNWFSNNRNRKTVKIKTGTSLVYVYHMYAKFSGQFNFHKCEGWLNDSWCPRSRILRLSGTKPSCMITTELRFNQSLWVLIYNFSLNNSKCQSSGEKSVRVVGRSRQWQNGWFCLRIEQSQFGVYKSVHNQGQNQKWVTIFVKFTPSSTSSYCQLNIILFTVPTTIF